MKIELTGWRAVIALLVIAGLFIGRFSLQRSTLEAEATQTIALWLWGEYSSHSLHGADVGAMDDSELEQLGAELLANHEISFPSIRARGFDDDEVYVRVEVLVSGREPPDGRSVRYYRLSHGLATGWRVQREVSPISYYLKLF